MSNSLSEVFATNVRTRLAAIQMSKRQLASKANVSRNTINSACTGQAKMIKFETISQIAQALRCSPRQLFDEDHNWALYKWANDYRKEDEHD